ncbi:hypothetical protein CRUP_026230 [Coryphaenoides rupestris]|nr:hypothetical protein CRUP_026230 [Coryphaenoides rupestris]
MVMVVVVVVRKMMVMVMVKVMICGDLLCGSTFFSLAYGDAQTGPLAVNSEAEDVAAALNDLWSLKPDSVQVSKEVHSQGAHFTVTFVSERGDFEDLRGTSMSGDTTVSVTEVTEGRGSMDTFTLQWGKVPSRPITFNATAEEVKSALDDMFVAECPGEIQTMEGSNVFYYRDFEYSQFEYIGDERGTAVNDTEAFCGSWSLRNPEVLFMNDYRKESGGRYGRAPLQVYPTSNQLGMLTNVIGVRYKFRDGDGASVETTTQITFTTISQGHTWSYTCVDLLSPLQTASVGSGYELLHLYLYKAESQQDFYVDAVHLGKRPTTSNIPAVLQKRRPPAFAASGRSFRATAVTRVEAGDDGAVVRYEVTATPRDCAHGFPLLDVAFLPVLSCLSLNIAAEDLRYALESIPGMGQVQVREDGDCQRRKWMIKWLTRPGDQPMIQVNDTKVIGNNPVVEVKERTKGGLFLRNLGGDVLRTLETEPQVEVFINGIPSRCSGDCGFEWSEDQTPVVTGISPYQGSDGLGTLVTITGFGFASGNASVMIGDAKCEIQEVTVWVTFPSLGLAWYQADVPNFTYQLIVSSFSPLSGSVAGGTLLTVTGYGFCSRATVSVGGEECRAVDVRQNEFTCRTPAVRTTMRNVVATI